MAENMFDGFDHTQYKEEVEQRWGKEAYARSDAWWRGMDATGQQAWKDRVAALNSDWMAACVERALPPIRRQPRSWRGATLPGCVHSGNARIHIRRQSQRLRPGPGRMYVADPRFAANYGGTAGRDFVRDALAAYAEREL